MQPESTSHSSSHSSSSSATPWRANLVSLNNPHQSPLSGTRDLISHFHLEPLYDTFLRPYLPSSLSSSHHALAHTDADQLSLGGASGAGGGGGGGPAMTIGGLQSNSTHATTMTTLPPVPGQVVLPSGGTGGRTQTQRGGAHVKATPASPAGTSTSGTAAAQGGLKITLGGIKLAGLNAPNLAGGGGGGGGEGTPQKKPRKPKMEKSYEYMVGDVLGRISQPRANAASSSASSSLLHLVSNPDPAPCPPLHPFDPQQLREAFTLKPGTLAGFDMSIWEARDPNGGVGGGPADERRRKKKKRKHDDPNAIDPKKQRR